MKTYQFFIFSILTLTVLSCTNSDKGNTVATSEPVQIQPINLAEGFQLTQNNCFSCHSPNPASSGQIAPPMQDIKKHYVDAQTTQAQFSSDMIAFLNHPNEEISKMPEAIEQYGLMPKMGFNEEQITKIASYIFNSELEKPDWFEKQYPEDKQKYGGAVQSSPIETGQAIAMKTKSVLGSNLLAAINTKGTEGALSFCSTSAIPLTDSMSVALNATVKRVSDKNRNPNNAANDSEMAYIEHTKLAITLGEKPLPKLSTVGNKLLGYYPIMTGQMCLQCHGEPEVEILPNTLSKIETLYPDDKAVGYSADELRGIWVIEWDKE